jgi:exo-beta-1,3-glucanase (GH17 family)
MTPPIVRVCFGLSALVCVLVLAGCRPIVRAGSLDPTWEEKVLSIRWVAYSPSTGDPVKGIEPTPAEIEQDLITLRAAGFTGLVTYSSTGIVGSDLPAIAVKAGFQGIINGVWDPTKEAELTAAIVIAQRPIVLCTTIGNEGLEKRYDFPTLQRAIEKVRTATGKPVTTTEEIDDYTDERLLKLGDWVFPNAHPYFHAQVEPKAAVAWTKGAFDDVRRRAKRFVLFKEVGLPTEGDKKNPLSETAQDEYYAGLAATDVKFVYFEAFDLRWKQHLPIEPHWGLFKADRTPKRIALTLGYKARPESAKSTPAFQVYSDADSAGNHFQPTGKMGDCGDITVNVACPENPRSGTTCVKLTYTPAGVGPHSCDYSPPCNWAGCYWQEPANNWGRDAAFEGAGFDLRAYNKLVFWVRAEKDATAEFKVGGIVGRYGDSLTYARAARVRVTTSWTRHSVDLDGANLSRIIGGFCVTTNRDQAPAGMTLFLDDIQFVKE